MELIKLMAGKEKPFLIGEYECFPDELTLLRQGEKITLEPKVMQLLCVLATNPGNVIKKEDILKQVWTDRVVVDGVLKRAISALRRALNDDATQPDYIETVPRMGYRLLPRVVPLSSNISEPNITTDKLRGSRKFNRIIWPGLLMVCVLLVVLWTSYNNTNRAAADTKTVATPTIAILTMSNQTGNSHYDNLCTSLSIAVRNELQTVQSLNSISDLSVISESLELKPLATIAERLGATHLVSASLESHDDVVTIHTSFFNSTENKLSDLTPITIQSGQLDNLYELQKELKQKILLQLQKTDTDDISEPTNSNAYALYLRGLYHLQTRDAESIVQAINFFEQSLGIDYQYAPAHAMMAIARVISAEHLPGNMSEVLISAWKHAKFALDLAPNLAEAHTAAGLVYFNRSNLKLAKKHFLNAIELNPNLSEAHMWLGGVYYEQGELAMAYKHQRQALTLNPLQTMGHIVAADTSIAIDDTLTANYHLDQVNELNPEYAFAAYMQSLVAAINLDKQVLKKLLTFDINAYSIEADQFRTRWMASGVAALFLDDFDLTVKAFEHANIFDTTEEIVAPWLHGGTLILYLSYLEKHNQLLPEQIDMASKYIQASIKEYPNDAYLLSALSGLQLIQHQPDAALATFKQAVEDGLRGCNMYQRDPRFNGLRSYTGFKETVTQLCSNSKQEREDLREMGIQLLRTD